MTIPKLPADVERALERPCVTAAETLTLRRLLRRESTRAAAAEAEVDRLKQPAFDLDSHLRRQRAFSEQTFGPGERTAGIIDHIRKELREIEAKPSDLSEWIDVVILALDGAWRVGFTPKQIIAALVAKQDKNEARTWPDWRTAEPGKAIEHDRTVEPAPAASEEEEALESLVFLAIGEASMCWEQTPKGIFESDRAKAIGEHILAEIAMRVGVLRADVASRDRIIASWKREEEAWHEREKSLKADVARLTRELFKAQDGIADIIRRTEDDTQERIRAAAEAAVKEAQRDDVLFTAFVFGFLRRDLEKRSCLPPPEWYSEDSMIAMILEAIRARAEKE